MKTKTLFTIASIVVPIAVEYVLKKSKSDDHDQYYAVIGGLADRYQRMITDHLFKSDKPDCGLKEVFIFCNEIKEKAESKDIPLTKINRWLGYVQGCVICAGLTTVEKERNFTRPILRPLDFG